MLKRNKNDQQPACFLFFPNIQFVVSSNLFLLLTLFCTLVFSVRLVAADPFEYEVVPSSPISIPDDECDTWTSITVTVTDNFTINDLNVGLTIASTYREDLVGQITSPSGTTRQIFFQSGWWADNLDLVLDSDASTNYSNLGITNHNTGAPYYENGPYSPGYRRASTGNAVRTVTPAALDAFDGERAAGDWVMEVCDNWDGDNAYFRRVKLFFDGTPTLAIIDNFHVELITVQSLLSGNNKTNISNLADFLQGFKADDEIAVVRWDTVQEHGTVGFYVERKTADRQWQRLNSESMLPGLITAPQGGQYLFLDPDVARGEIHTYRLVEEEIWGTRQKYGPWRVTIGEENAMKTSKGIRSFKTAQTKTGQVLQNEKKQHWGQWHSLEKGYASRAREAVVPVARLKRNNKQYRKNKSRINRVRLRTREATMYQVSVDDLAIVTGINSKTIARKLLRGRWSFSTGDGPAAYFYDTEQQKFIFAADTYLTTETMDNVYRLGKFRLKQGWNMDVVTGPGPEAGMPDQFRDTLYFAEENWLLSWVHNHEDEDYGYWDYVYAPYKSTAELSIDLPDPAAGSTEQGSLKVLLRGAGNKVEGNDHLARVYLNGELLAGEVEWDGTDQAVLEVSFDQAQLGGTEAGETITATVTVEGEALNGAPYSLFYVESVEISYDRKMYAQNNALRLHNTMPGVVTVSGFAGEDIKVIEAPNTRDALWREDITISQAADGYQVSFESFGGEYQLSSAPITLQPEADYPSRLLSRRNRADYLIIAPRTLQQSAEALFEYRSHRFRTKIAWLQDIYDVFSSGRVDSGAIEEFLDLIHDRWRQPPEYVVLMGRGTLDHPDRKGYGESLIPLRMAATPWGLIGSDNRYADVDGDHVPEYSIGRIAVSNDDDGLAYVNKLIAYEAQGPASWNTHAVVAADDPDPNAGDFHANSDETAEALQGYGFTVDKLYHPDNSVRDTLLADWAAGKFGFVNYNGHGGRVQLGTASEKFLHADDVATLSNGIRLPVFSAQTCATGDSSYPGTLSLGDTLSLQADGGSIVSFVPTGLSLDGPAHRLNTFYIKALMGEEKSVGNAARSALLQAGKEGIKTFMLDVYTLSGDPAVEMTK